MSKSVRWSMLGDARVGPGSLWHRNGRGLLAVALTILLVLPSGARAAATFDAALDLRLTTASATDNISVLIEMSDGADPPLDLPSLSSGNVPRAVSHARTINLLQQRATSSQAGLKSVLTQFEQTGKVQGVRHFWIDNLVGASLQPEVIRLLQSRSDIERIVLLPDVEIVEPQRTAAVSAIAAGHESGLDVIGAPAMWALGYAGQGRLVCGIDTGVRGTHAQLADRWRGNRVPAEHAWHDPRGTTTVPTDVGTNPVNHGSHTMGTMVGADTSTGDTVGVAPGAEWIAAFGIGSSQLNTLDLIECMEWTADPDGNPNTTADVPDVLNCSWRFSVQGIVDPCNNIMDNIIEHLEAVGVIVVWAAGNEGASASTIGYPANSGTSFGTNFAVGNVSGADSSIAGSSSRGPTPCAVDSIKPEVSAPGIGIRSCFRASDISYGTLSGTSMAAPHVAGAAAILRQVAPNATPAQIKQALYLSAFDLGPVGEDNAYGRGLINIPAAADSLSVLMGGPDLRIESEQLTVVAGVAAASSGAGDSLHAGDSVSLDFLVRNTAMAAATSAYLRLTTVDPNVTLLVDSVSLGIIPGGDTLTAPSALRFQVMPGAPEGQTLKLTLELHAAGYMSSRGLAYNTDPAPVRGHFAHDNTLVEFGATNYGLYGVGDQSYYPLGGSGFIHGPSTTDHLAEGALMMGVSQSQISDAARSAGGADGGFQISDADFAVSPGGAIQTIPNFGGSFQASACMFDDGAAENPIGIRVTQRSMIFPRGPDEGFALLILTLENISAGAISGLHVGMLHDWDFPTFLAGNDTVGFSASQNIGYMFDVTQVASGPYRGVAVVSDSGATAYRAVSPQDVFYTTAVGEVLRADSVKWQMLSAGIGPMAVPSGTFGDMTLFTGTGPYSLAAPGDTVQVAFAYVGSEDGLARLLTNAAAAKDRYDSIVAISTDITEGPQIPREFSLSQNFPNPFNPQTRIEFALLKPGFATVTIYNVLGARVRNLYEALAPAGSYSITWDGTDKAGSALGSGVYFYRLTLDGESVARKMLLLR